MGSYSPGFYFVYKVVIHGLNIIVEPDVPAEAFGTAEVHVVAARIPLDFREFFRALGTLKDALIPLVPCSDTEYDDVCDLCDRGFLDD